MRRSVAILVAILVGAVVWFFFQHFKIEGARAIRVVPKSEQELNSAAASSDDSDDSSFSRFSFPRFSFGSKPEGQQSDAALQVETSPQVITKPVKSNPAPQLSRNPDTILVASFHLTQFGSQIDDSEVAINGVARIVRLFDVIALQGISSTGEAGVVDVATKAGPHFGCIFSKAGTGDHRFAFIYNQNTVVADRGEGLYTLGDPDNLLQRDPLIGWFKAKRPAAEDAFTFTLVNVNTDRRRAIQELNLLDNVVHEVRQDWRNEDDVILLGCFQRPETAMEELGTIRGIVPVIRNVPTNLLGDYQSENILFKGMDTDEFTGRSGVFQFLRAYNLAIEDAQLISEYLPIWAEFSIYEGGQQGRVARRESTAK